MEDRLESVNQVFQEDGPSELGSSTSRRQFRLVVVAAALGLAVLAWPAVRLDRWSFGDIERFYFPLHIGSLSV